MLWWKTVSNGVGWTTEIPKYTNPRLRPGCMYNATKGMTDLGNCPVYISFRGKTFTPHVWADPESKQFWINCGDEWVEVVNNSNGFTTEKGE